MKILVTGGGGFLGGAIVRMLVERGDQVRTFGRGNYPHLQQLGVQCHAYSRMDSKNVLQWLDALKAAADGCEVVVHTAAKAGVWGKHDEYHTANSIYTSVVVDACRECGVNGLVHTSSPSVVFAGMDEDGIGESTQYPSRYLAAYPKSKAAAERIVLKHADELPTTILRPHLIWGPRDPHLVPRIVKRAKAGKLKLVGDGSKLVDSTYIDNAAHAHILAADQLVKHGTAAACAGKTYFISNGEPLAMADLINRILNEIGRAHV